MSADAPRPSWQPLLKVRDKFGKDRTRAELYQRRWEAKWTDDGGQDHIVSAAYWADDNADGTGSMETGNIDSINRRTHAIAPAQLFVRPVQASPQPAKDRGGRLSVYAWEEALLYAIGKFYLGTEPEPKTQAEIERWMAEYLATKDQHPEPSGIRPHARLLWQALKSWKDRN